MTKFNLIGKKFNMLTVIAYSSNKKINCICECGNKTIVRHNHLMYGHTKSCGCLILKKVRTHNGSYSRLYSIWGGMKQRCLNPKHQAYKSYGGRGITIYPNWINSFIEFENWAKNNGYKKDLTLDRIDNNKGYSPKNCRFATSKEQSSNRRDCILYKKETAKDASKRLGGSSNMVTQRIREYGWSIKDAFTIPARTKNK